MSESYFLSKIDNLKTKDDKINFLKEVWSNGYEAKQEELHKLKSVLFLIANTYISGDPRNSEFIKISGLIKMAGDALTDLESNSDKTERDLNG
jgi:hypothetical protein